MSSNFKGVNSVGKDPEVHTNKQGHTNKHINKPAPTIKSMHDETDEISREDLIQGLIEGISFQRHHTAPKSTLAQELQQGRRVVHKLCTFDDPLLPSLADLHALRVFLQAWVDEDADTGLLSVSMRFFTGIQHWSNEDKSDSMSAVVFLVFLGCLERCLGELMDGAHQLLFLDRLPGKVRGLLGVLMNRLSFVPCFLLFEVLQSNHPCSCLLLFEVLQSNYHELVINVIQYSS